MKKQILFLIIYTCLSLNSFSQIIFENGYFINDSSQRFECLIKNVDWKYSPSEFVYKLLQDTTAQKATVETVMEFGIYGASKYVRSTVLIDRSLNNINSLGYEKNPNFQTEQLFLKVLIESNASLFLFEDINLTRFFYKVNDSEVKQLVYKRYLNDNKVVHNNYFKQQLFNDLKCQNIELNDFENLKYTKRDLERVFIKYNECNSSGYINYDLKQKTDLFNLTFRPGVNLSNLTMQNSVTELRNVEFPNEFNFRFGIEAEYILSFNKNKWGLIIEPTYQCFNSEKVTQSSYFSGGVFVTRVKYQSIELPMGVRHYFFLNDKSKIFADISYLFDFSRNSSIVFTRNDGSFLYSFDVKSRRNYAIGIGYKYMNSLSLQIRYQTGREILSDYIYWRTSYKTLSLIFGYSIF
jgi:hypothetical protein